MTSSHRRQTKDFTAADNKRRFLFVSSHQTANHLLYFFHQWPQLGPKEEEDEEQQKHLHSQCPLVICVASFSNPICDGAMASAPDFSYLFFPS